MKRKVLKIGMSSLAVSIPTKWAKQHNLRPGDEIDILEGDTLTIAKEIAKNTKKAAVLNADNMSYFMLVRNLSVYYWAGYDNITINFPRAEIYHHKHQNHIPVSSIPRKLADRFIGAEIVSQTGKSIEIEFFVAEELRDLDKIERRIYFLLKEMFTEMLDAISRKRYREFHETVYDRHDNIAKFINYYLRMLGSSDKSEEERKVAYALYVMVDKMVDKVRHTSERIDKHGCDKKLASLLAEIFSFFTQQFTYLSNTSLEEELIEKRYALRRKLDEETFTTAQLAVLSEASILLDAFSVFVELIVARTLKV